MTTLTSPLVLPTLQRVENRLQVHKPPHHCLPRVEQIDRKGPTLHLSPLVDSPEVLSLNLTRGCAHRCAFCSVRAQSAYPGDDVVYLYRDTARHLDVELSSRPRKPRAVYVSPATDPFPPLGEVQIETLRVVEVLARHGVEAWLMTRGYIRPSILQGLATQRHRVKVTMGLTTLDRKLHRILEPLAAPPRLRLRQIANLRALGVAVQVGVEPLLPGLTDTRANLQALLEGLSVAGVRHITVGYAFLRPGIRDQLVQILEAHGWNEEFLEAYEDGPLLEAGSLAPARYLPKAIRQRSYAALMALAAPHNITVSVCGLTNPDFRKPRPAPAESRSPRRLLPLFE